MGGGSPLPWTPVNGPLGLPEREGSSEQALTPGGGIVSDVIEEDEEETSSPALPLRSPRTVDQNEENELSPNSDGELA